MDSAIRDVLPAYWSRMFPHKAIYEWLNYGQENLFSTREFVFNFGKDGDRFLRNLSFRNIEELKDYVKKTKPNKIDIGAVYPKPPTSRTVQKPVQKEIVIDIDLTDYDDVRTCCSGANICRKCWKYVSLAIKILDTALREDFDYKLILWVFSGRRGVHAWICDKSARMASSRTRLIICNYLQIVKGGAYVAKKVHLREKIHHSEGRALKMIDKVFVQLAVIEQDMLGTDKNLDKFVGLLKEELRIPIKKYLQGYPTSLSRWNAFLHLFNQNKETKKIRDWIEKPYLIEEIKLQYTYPRIDLQVTHNFSHLLKCPFSIHPKTGLMGVPIDHTKVDEFDPLSLPTILQLMDQKDRYCEIVRESMQAEMLMNAGFFNYTHDLEKTVLGENYHVFYKFLHSLILDRN